MNQLQQQLLNLKSAINVLSQEGLIGIYKDSKGNIEIQVTNKDSRVYNQCLPFNDGPTFEVLCLDDGTKWSKVSKFIFGIKVFYFKEGEVDHE